MKVQAAIVEYMNFCRYMLPVRIVNRSPVQKIAIDRFNKKNHIIVRVLDFFIVRAIIRAMNMKAPIDNKYDRMAAKLPSMFKAFSANDQHLIWIPNNFLNLLD